MVQRCLDTLIPASIPPCRVKTAHRAHGSACFVDDTGASFGVLGLFYGEGVEAGLLTVLCHCVCN